MAIFKKLNVGDTVATSGTRVFKKLSTNEPFTINGTYRFNDTITELPIVYADGADFSEQTTIGIPFRDRSHTVGMGGLAMLIYGTDGKVLRYEGFFTLPSYYFDTNSWRNNEDRYVTFYNATATNVKGEDITQIFYKWLTDNTTKQGKITFTIDGTTYQADDGMSWNQWCFSDYNTAGYDIGLDHYVSKGDYYIATAVSDGTTDYRVKRSDVIIAGYNYALYNPDAPTPGLYDSNGDLLADWDTLVNAYGMIDGGEFDDVGTYENSPAEVFSSNEELASGTKLIISKDRLNDAHWGFTSNHSCAYANCTNLKSVILEEGCETVWVSMFRDCTNLTSVSIPASVTDIRPNAFSGCTSLTGIWVDENNEVYSSDEKGVVFNKDRTQLIMAPKALSAYTIPDSVGIIAVGAFSDCGKLTSVTIPTSVTSIVIQAFSGCTNLTDVYYRGTEEQWAAISIYSGNDYLKNATIHYNYTD